MKTKFLLSVLLISIGLNGNCTIMKVTSPGFTFSPATLTINYGDTVNFAISGSHNAREVTQATYNANGNVALPGGFETPLGGGKIFPLQLAVGTHYYVCVPHAGLGMKGIIIVQGCQTPAMPGNITGDTIVCAGSVKTYSIASVMLSTSYSWTLPAGWNGSSTTNTISVTAGNVGGTISVTANNACGSSMARTLNVLLSNIPSTPATITGDTTFCPGDIKTYSTASIALATSYTWMIPAGWAGSSTTNSITVTTGNAGGTISVSANNDCGSSSARTLNTSLNNIPATPGIITGDTTFCAGITKTYNTAPVALATSYTWILPAGWIGTSTTNSISVTAGAVGGTISVIANNACGYSLAQSLNLILSNGPAMPGNIATTGGAGKVCAGDTRIYTTNNAAGVTWNWTVPVGAIINSGQGTRSINVTYNNSFIANGLISVVRVNSCGSSLPRTLTVARNTPATPGAITGTLTGLCNASNVPYSVPAVVGVTYDWVVPPVASIVSGQTTNSIVVNFPFSAFTGTLAVTASNACGVSAQRKATLNSLLAAPATITGSVAVCANQASVPYSISPIATALNYTWTGPAGSHISDGINTSVNNVLTTSATAVTVNYGPLAGTLKVRANNACGGGGSRSVVITIICRLANEIADNILNAFPDPSSGMVTQIFNSKNNQNCELMVSDITGRIIIQKQINAESGKNEINIDLSGFVNGIYVVKLKTQEREFVNRIVKD